MEPDRFEQNHSYFIVGLICLIASLSLFAFTLYLLPFLLLHWRYHVPEFITILLHAMQTEYGLSPAEASWFVFLAFFMLALALALIADFTSNRIDNEIHHIASEATTDPKEARKAQSSNRDFLMLIARISFIIILVFLVAELFHWMISA